MQAFPDHFGVTSSPEQFGFDAERLTRITRHFDRWVDLGVLPGWAALVARHGEPVFAGHGGLRDLDLGLPVEPDTLWRLFSMTKPVTSVAAMMLVEQGLLGLDDPVSEYLPEFSDLVVHAGGSASSYLVRPAAQTLKIWHLLSHTSGLTLGLAHMDPVDALYRGAGLDVLPLPGTTLEQMCRDVARLPLLFDPGTSWNYSLTGSSSPSSPCSTSIMAATDVTGFVMENRRQSVSGSTGSPSSRFRRPPWPANTGSPCRATSADHPGSRPRSTHRSK